MLPDGSGLDLLRQMKRRDQSADIIMVTALQGVQTALDAMKGEAQDYITKPFKINELRGLIKNILAKKRTAEWENQFLRIEASQQKSLCLMGTSQVLQDMMKKIESAAETETPVCLAGEAGAGVEEVAQEIHLRSRRKHGPFITLNCLAYPENQIERELFGEEMKSKPPQIGKLEFADKGTIFLKQFDRLSLKTQDKLMAVFSEKVMFKRGSRIRVPLDVRVIVSSEVDIVAKFVKGFFRLKFYRFLNNCAISVPPLRERKEDIPALIEQILKTANRKAKIPVKKIQKTVIRFLTDYPWPRNLSELENSIETMVLFAGHETLTMEDIPLDIVIKQMDLAKPKREAKLSLKRVELQFERKYIRKVLENNRGHQTLTAKALGINRNTLIWKLKELDLEEDYKTIVQKRRKHGVGFQGL